MSFTITLSPGGHRFSCEPGETILDAALRQGVHLNYGCRSGRCGTCMGQLLSGEVTYAEAPRALKDGARLDKPALYCMARPASDLEILSTEVDVTSTFVPGRMPCKVVGMEKLCHDVMKINLKLPEAIRVQFMAGQYLDIFQPQDGERRSFSIANAPHDDDTIELHVRNVAGGEFTEYIFTQLKVNDILRIEIPLGTFFLRESSRRPVILMGGGTGFAPLKGIIEHAVHIRHSQPMHLFWGVRSSQDLYSGLPEKWLQQIPGFRYTPVLSESLKENNWQGKTGFVHEAVLEQYPDLSGHDVYMSGPPVMIHAARELFLQAGLPVDHMYSDAFEYNAHPDAG